MSHRTDDLRILDRRPLLPPSILIEELPLPAEGAAKIASARRQISAILSGADDRLLAVVGPCSIHDPEAGLEYARRLAEQAARLSDELLVVMRVYFEKPRTSVGWKGLVNDPHLDGSFAINDGLRLARRLLLDITKLDLPAATEFLDPITPQFMADVVAWGAIGARTSESQVHRELASGLSMPVGFKNATNGSIQIAIDAVRSSAHPHHFLGVTKQGLAAILSTRGNRDCHVVLRGGHEGPNYSAEQIAKAQQALRAAGLTPRLMVDCSHANSGKDPLRQAAVIDELCRQLERDSDALCGVMIESFLVGGSQEQRPGKALTFGQSITDGCLSFERTVPLLERLAEANRRRRRHAAGASGAI